MSDLSVGELRLLTKSLYVYDGPAQAFGSGTEKIPKDNFIIVLDRCREGLYPMNYVLTPKGIRKTYPINILTASRRAILESD